MPETRHGRRSATKILMPLVASAAGAVASYLAKKAPQYLEETLLPRLRETTETAGSTVEDVAHDLADRARSVAAGVSGETGEHDITNDELERRRRERAEHRAARRKAS
jgi:malic enzyme